MCAKTHIEEIPDILRINNPEEMEIFLNNIPGVVDNGVFAFDKPEIVLVGD